MGGKTFDELPMPLAQWSSTSAQVKNCLREGKVSKAIRLYLHPDSCTSADGDQFCMDGGLKNQVPANVRD